MRPLLLDLYCGAGGASKGYHDAGFDVIGVDLHPQPNYPFPFVQMSALDVDIAATGAVVVHASPPCQAFTALAALHAADTSYAERHLDLVAATRDMLIAAGLPWVIENVPQAPLVGAVTLCGSMFELPVRRHRAFETSFELSAPACNHGRWRELWPDGFPRDVSKARIARGASTRSSVVGVYGNGGGPGKVLDTWRWAMGTPWMGTKHEIAESIPPAYTEFVGRQLLAQLA